MKFIPNIATGPPVLNEEMFQRLLAAAHVMQQCNDRYVDGARTDVEPLAARRDSLIPPTTAYQLAALASQLQVALADIQTDSGLNTRPPTAVAPEKSAEGQQTAARHVGIQEEASFEQPTSEPRQLIPLLQSGVPSGTSILRQRILRRRISQIKNLFLRTVTMVAIAGLLAALVYRSLLLPGGLALSRLHSTYSATVVSEVQHRIRTDHRLQMTQVQVRASNGIITLSGDVGSAAERVAVVQDAAQIKGVRVVVDNLRVIDPNRQGPTPPVQASVARTASRSKAPIIPAAGAFRP